MVAGSATAFICSCGALLTAFRSLSRSGRVGAFDSSIPAFGHRGYRSVLLTTFVRFWGTRPTSRRLLHTTAHALQAACNCVMPSMPTQGRIGLKGLDTSTRRVAVRCCREKRGAHEKYAIDGVRRLVALSSTFDAALLRNAGGEFATSDTRHIVDHANFWRS
jgi:hypothetical protein